MPLPQKTLAEADLPPWVRPRDLAAFLGIHQATARLWLRDKTLPKLRRSAAGVLGWPRDQILEHVAALMASGVLVQSAARDQIKKAVPRMPRPPVTLTEADLPPWVKSTDLAAFLNVHRGTVTEWVRRKVLPEPVRPTARIFAWPKDQILAHVAAMRAAGTLADRPRLRKGARHAKK
jgi:predicted DNA-binding transcriptional regulator AlpA